MLAAWMAAWTVASLEVAMVGARAAEMAVKLVVHWVAWTVGCLVEH